jgi:hypothetical protein
MRWMNLEGEQGEGGSGRERSAGRMWRKREEALGRREGETEAETERESALRQCPLRKNALSGRL